MGSYASNAECGELGWSNELSLHVIELKTKGPIGSLCCLPRQAQTDVQRINGLLRPLDACLMPTAMHPWMDPACESRLWPHDYSPVYEAFNRIFGCQGHGWSNLQSQHLNLPFSGDAEFARLHAAIRVILPLVPALAASSPIQDGRVTGLLDNRLAAYRANCAKIPSITGHVIPEPVFGAEEYARQILEPMYRDIAPWDPEGVLQDEWLNARGAIARFDRNAIEIRLLDVQECPHADVAIAALIVGVVRALVEERWCDFATQAGLQTEPLARVLQSTIACGETAVIADGELLRALGIGATKCSAGEVWQTLAEAFLNSHPDHASIWAEPLSVILRQGCLARRILRILGKEPTRERLKEVYSELCRCLPQNKMLVS